MMKLRKLIANWLWNGIQIEIKDLRRKKLKLIKSSRMLMKLILYFLILKKERLMIWEDMMLWAWMEVWGVPHLMARILTPMKSLACSSEEAVAALLVVSHLEVEKTTFWNSLQELKVEAAVVVEAWVAWAVWAIWAAWAEREVWVASQVDSTSCLVAFLDSAEWVEWAACLVQQERAEEVEEANNKGNE
jgi:hypothetical protein